MVKWINGTQHYAKGRGGKPIEYIILHHAATTNPGIVLGAFNGNGTSAHYLVADNEVYQYVNESDTAYHAGNWDANQKSIGIEHINSSGPPTWNVSGATIHQSAKLCADIAKRQGWKSLAIGQNVRFHSDFSATACPGQLRDKGLGQQIVNEANKILSGGQPQPAPQAPQTVKPPVATQPQANGWISESGTYIPNTATNLRTGASVSSGLIATIQPGNAIKYDAYKIDGNYVWIRQPRANGFGYMATGQASNGKRLNYWGSFK